MSPDPADRAAIVERCRDLIVRFARANDENRYDELAAMFTPDGSFARPSEPTAPIRGRAAILAAFQARPPRTTRHLVGNVVVTVEAADRAHARSCIVLFTGPAGAHPVTLEATLVGDFDDVLRLVDGGWLFAERCGTLALRA